MTIPTTPSKAAFGPGVVTDAYKAGATSGLISDKDLFPQLKCGQAIQMKTGHFVIRNQMGECQIVEPVTKTLHQKESASSNPKRDILENQGPSPKKAKMQSILKMNTNVNPPTTNDQSLGNATLDPVSCVYTADTATPTKAPKHLVLYGLYLLVNFT